MTHILDTTPATRKRMSKVRQKSTAPELALRKELFRLGLRFRIDRVVLNKPRRVADIVFPKQKIAIFVDGCFWHGCPTHATWPKNNAEFWRKKIESNVARDIDTNARLEGLGWSVFRIWAHESATEAAQRIQQIINQKHILSPK